MLAVATGSRRPSARGFSNERTTEDSLADERRQPPPVSTKEGRGRSSLFAAASADVDQRSRRKIEGEIGTEALVSQSLCSGERASSS
ncbi:hypothetical protein Dimus_030544, partial [Dionaea muscipula]